MLQQYVAVQMFGIYSAKVLNMHERTKTNTVLPSYFTALL